LYAGARRRDGAVVLARRPLPALFLGARRADAGDAIPGNRAGRGGAGGGAALWFWLAGLYLLSFWALAGQTPGMRFLGIALDGGGLGLRRAIRRLFGFALATIPFGAGFLG